MCSKCGNSNRKAPLGDVTRAPKPEGMMHHFRKLNALFLVSVGIGNCFMILCADVLSSKAKNTTQPLAHQEHNGPNPTRVEIWMIDMYPHIVASFLLLILRLLLWAHTHTCIYFCKLSDSVKTFNSACVHAKDVPHVSPIGQWIRHLNTRCAGSCLTQKGCGELQISIIHTYKNSQLQRPWQW